MIKAKAGHYRQKRKGDRTVAPAFFKANFLFALFYLCEKKALNPPTLGATP